MVTQSPVGAEGRPLSGRRYGGVTCAATPSAFVALLRLVEAPPRFRRDALPENTHYADTGCDLQPSCLSCPLVRCRYDEPGGLRGAEGRERDQAILQVRRKEGITVAAIARRFGVSRRTVFRVLARGREEEAARW